VKRKTTGFNLIEFPTNFGGQKVTLFKTRKAAMKERTRRKR
tara:strand:+ start:115 stop:237 length:123 start_codon:yes stop_codon:yes gene_type:complete